MMSLHRKISKVQAFAIDLTCAYGISSKATYVLMSREDGGRANLGYTKLNQKNYLRTRWQKNLIDGEVGCLLRYFQEQLAKNPSFQYVVQLDNEKQITSIF
jgi:hypothetical protein